MEIFGYIASVFIGISLGMVGGGGSILTVPVLVYIFGLSPVMSTSYSLFIVGTTSLTGAFTNYRKGLVQIKTAAVFGLVSTATVFITRKLVVPGIPQNVTIGTVSITEPRLTMLLFALLMLGAAVGMIRRTKTKPGCLECNLGSNLVKLLLSATGIGLTTGLLGAGGGFLLIPVLVLVLGIPMREAVGTSLLIIALNSLIGFTGDLEHFSINWHFLLTITFIAIAGLFIGTLLSRHIDAAYLKKGFGWLVAAMGCFILFKELLS